MKIEIDDQSGFCFGVVNAIRRAEEVLLDGSRLYSLGDIVHNDSEIERLHQMGMETIDLEGLQGLKQGDKVLIRAHGEPPSTYTLARERQVGLIDATCPVVARLQQTVKEAYRQMELCNGQVVILGKRGHAEVVGLTGQIGGRAMVIENEQEVDNIDFTRPVTLISQTTRSEELFNRVAQAIRSKAREGVEVVVKNTICRQVAGREEHLTTFAKRHDVVVFVCGEKSSNGRVLFEVCHGANPRSHKISDHSQLQAEWFAGCRSVGICGATSTPLYSMQQTAEAIERITTKNQE